MPRFQILLNQYKEGKEEKKMILVLDTLDVLDFWSYPDGSARCSEDR